MTFLWQEERGFKFYKVQTDERAIADILKRRKGFHICLIGLNVKFWIYNCEFTRPDIARKVLENQLLAN